MCPIESKSILICVCLWSTIICIAIYIPAQYCLSSSQLPFWFTIQMQYFTDVYPLLGSWFSLLVSRWECGTSRLDSFLWGTNRWWTEMVFFYLTFPQFCIHNFRFSQNWYVFLVKRHSESTWQILARWWMRSNVWFFSGERGVNPD
jgi:hypothetical protein